MAHHRGTSELGDLNIGDFEYISEDREKGHLQKVRRRIQINFSVAPLEIGQQ